MKKRTKRIPPIKPVEITKEMLRAFDAATKAHWKTEMHLERLQDLITKQYRAKNRDRNVSDFVGMGK